MVVDAVSDDNESLLFNDDDVTTVEREQGAGDDDVDVNDEADESSSFNNSNLRVISIEKSRKKPFLFFSLSDLLIFNLLNLKRASYQFQLAR